METTENPKRGRKGIVEKVIREVRKELPEAQEYFNRLLKLIRAPLQKD